MNLPLNLIEYREREIALRERIPYDRADRSWLRRLAMRELRAELAGWPQRDAISDVFDAARETVARLEHDRGERDAWLNHWRPSDEVQP